MIKNTFSILPGIGEHLEKKLWSYGILCWEDFLERDVIEFINSEQKKRHDIQIETALRHLNLKNADFFYHALKQRDHWRLYSDFKDAAVALDIETDGRPANQGGCITVVGLYDGCEYTPLIKGVNLTKSRLEQELAHYKYLITFYGSVFDLPFLRQYYNLTIDYPHFDLCFCGRRTGLKGGLKSIEEMLGITRNDAVKKFTGIDAVLLWHEAERGNDAALELLMTYNRCDTEHLFLLADIIFARLVSQTGYASFATQAS